MGRRRYQHPSVRKSESKSKEKQYWFFRARVDQLVGPGEVARDQKPFFLGFCSEMTKREAEKLRDTVLAEVVNKPELVLKSQIKFGYVIERFLEDQENGGHCRRHSATTMACLVNKHLVPAFGEMRLCDIDHDKVQSWLYGLAKPPAELATNTRRNARAVFGQIWKLARLKKFTTEGNPAEDTLIGRRFGEREKTLPTVDQFKMMLAALEEPYRSVLMLATFTGLRISEVRALRWEQFGSRNGFLVIAESKSQLDDIDETKTPASNRAIPVGHLKAAILSLRPVGAAGSSLVFDLKYDRILKRLKKAAAVAGIEYKGFGCHSLRRLNNTWFREGGGSVEVAMDQLGHTSQEMNDLYFIQDARKMTARSEMMEAMYEKVMFSKPTNNETGMSGEREKPQ